MNNQKGFAPLLSILLVIAVIAIGGYFVLNTKVAVAPTPSSAMSSSPNPTDYACTQEAKLCPDGSYVGRTGPKCEFAPCPTVKVTSGISGTVKTGPTCPVQRVGDHSCDDKLYKGDFVVKIFDATAGKTAVGQEMARFSTDVNGKYSVNLPPGDFIIVPVAQVGIGRQTEYVTVRPNEFKTFDFTLDTGIR